MALVSLPIPTKWHILFKLSGLNAGSLAGDVFTNNALMGFFEIIAHCIAPLIMDLNYLGRRGALSLMFFIGGISCLGSLLFKNLSRCATDEVTLCDEVSQVFPLFLCWLNSKNVVPCMQYDSTSNLQMACFHRQVWCCCMFCNHLYIFCGTISNMCSR